MKTVVLEKISKPSIEAHPLSISNNFSKEEEDKEEVKEVHELKVKTIATIAKNNSFWSLKLDNPILLEQFPKVEWEKLPNEDDPNRFFNLTYCIFFCFFLVGLKNYIVNQFELATFCDISEWGDFDKKVMNRQIKLLENVNCSDKCSDNMNLFLTKIFSFDYYFVYACSSYLTMEILLEGKLRGLIQNILTIAPFFNHFIGHLIFFHNKAFAFMIGHMLFTLEFLLIMKKSIIYFKVFLSISLLLGYFSGVKFFFEMIYPYLLKENSEVMMQIVPALLFFIKKMVRIIFKYPYFKVIPPKVLSATMVFFLLFEYLMLGTLHRIVNEIGFKSQAFWVTIGQMLFVDLISRTIFLKDFLSKTYKIVMKKKLRKNDVSFDFVNSLYLGMKIQLEFSAILLYLLLISSKYFDFCTIEIVDCMGRPIKPAITIVNSHFLLVLVLVCKIIIREIILLFLKNKTIPRISVKFESIKERLYYMIMILSATFTLAISGLYCMMRPSS